MEARQLTTVADVRAFIFAGNATFTLRSKKTGDRFTYKIRKPDEAKPWFVSLLTGSNNENDFTFFGTVFADGRYTHSGKSRLAYDATGPKAFAWFLQGIKSGVVPTQLEIWHEGRCGRCGRTLTVPESIELGLGPECATKFDCNKIPDVA
jgi:hypothetical protein